MDKNKIFRNGMVIGIIVLFFGASVVLGISEKNSNYGNIPMGDQEPVDELETYGPVPGKGFPDGDWNYYSNKPHMYAIPEGNVGIGTENPATKFHVTNGSVLFEPGPYTNSNLLTLSVPSDQNGYILQVAKGGWVKSVIDKDGYFGVGDYDPDAVLEVSTSGETKDPFMISSDDHNDGDILIVKNSGNIGIGTTSPDAKFHIEDGTILFDGTIGTTPVSGPGTRLMWIPSKAALRAGYVYANQWDDSNIGDNSVAMGFSTTASGSGSFAMGDGTNASGDSSTAIGNNTIASGESSTAMGYLTEASGDWSTALGSATIANGNYSTAIGMLTKASGDYGSTAMGLWTIASGIYGSTAMGYGTEASGFASTAMGRAIKVDGDYSVGIGLNDTSYTVDTDNVMSIMGGNVGIGTTTPNEKLDVDGTIQMTGFKMTDNAEEGHVLTSDINGNGTWQPAFDGNTLDAAYDEGGSGEGRNITADSGAVNILGPDGLLVNGSVGIGTISPEARLHVNSSSGIPLRVISSGGHTMLERSETGIANLLTLYNPNQTDGNAVSLNFRGDANTAVSQLFASINAIYTSHFPMSADITFSTRNNSNWGERLRIKSDGNVGIGTTDPQEELQVIGTVNMTGFKMPTSAEEGFVLTSDEDGIGTWQSPSGGELVLTSDGGGVGIWQPYPFLGGNTLDDAYDEGGPGEGRNITADAGPVNISGPDGLLVNSNIGIGTTDPNARLHILDNLLDYSLYIENNAPIDRTYGIYATVDSPKGRAIYGHATNATTGEPTYGIYGETESSDSGSSGVFGRSNANSGYSYGVYGLSNSKKGKGVIGIATRATASAKNTVGVYGESRSHKGAGVFGVADSDYGKTYGVIGKAISPDGIAVYGWGDNLTGHNYGVFGQSDSVNGTGVYGYAPNSSGDGRTYGVYGLSESSGDGSCGVKGVSNSTLGHNAGVYGLSKSKNAKGVFGYASRNSGVTFGVCGVSASKTGRGVYGYAKNSNGNTRGVLGQCVSPNGTAIYGWADSLFGSPFAIYGKVESPDGYAGFFEGKVNVTENLTVNGFVMPTGSDDGYVLTSDIAGKGTWQLASFVGNTLDEAYNQGGAGIGRTITANAGAVNISGPDGLFINGSVGVGTSNPLYKLDVFGDIRLTGILRDALGDGGTVGEVLQRTSSGIGWGSLSGVTDGDWLIDGDNMSSGVSGKLGIGTSNPSEKLDVNGTVQMTGFKMPAGHDDDYVLTSDSDGNGTWQPAFGGNTLDAAYDEGGPGLGKNITADSGSVNIIGTDGLTVNGKVGIGTSTPSKKLTIMDTPDPSILIGNDLNNYGLLGWRNDMGKKYLWLGTSSEASGNKHIVLHPESTSNSYVGIRTTDPSYLLDLGESEGRKLALYYSTLSKFFGFGVSKRGEATGRPNTLEFHVGTDDNGNPESLIDPQMVINTKGNVGIGTANPNAALDVNGTIIGGLPLTDVSLVFTELDRISGLMIGAEPSSGKVYIRSLEEKSYYNLDQNGAWGSWVDLGSPKETGDIGLIIDVSVSITANQVGPSDYNYNAIITTRYSNGNFYIKSFENQNVYLLDNSAVWGSWVSFGNPGL